MALLLHHVGAAVGRWRWTPVSEQLIATHDGFRIAEADLAQRGHGDLFGAAHSRRAALAAKPTSTEARRSAGLAVAERDRIEREDPALAQIRNSGGLRAAVLARWAAGAIYGAETG